MIHGKARKCMPRLKAKGDVQPSHIWRTNMQSHQERARVRPRGRDRALDPPRQRTGGEDGHSVR